MVNIQAVCNLLTYIDTSKTHAALSRSLLFSSMRALRPSYWLATFSTFSRWSETEKLKAIRRVAVECASRTVHYHRSSMMTEIDLNDADVKKVHTSTHPHCFKRFQVLPTDLISHRNSSIRCRCFSSSSTSFASDSVTMAWKVSIATLIE